METRTPYQLTLQTITTTLVFACEASRLWLWPVSYSKKVWRVSKAGGGAEDFIGTIEWRPRRKRVIGYHRGSYIGVKDNPVMLVREIVKREKAYLERGSS